MRAGRLERTCARRRRRIARTTRSSGSRAKTRLSRSARAPAQMCVHFSSFDACNRTLMFINYFSRSRSPSSVTTTPKAPSSRARPGQAHWPNCTRTPRRSGTTSPASSRTSPRARIKHYLLAPHTVPRRRANSPTSSRASRKRRTKTGGHPRAARERARPLPLTLAPSQRDCGKLPRAQRAGR